MNFSNFISLLKKNLKFILIFTAVVLFLVEFVAWKMSGGYDVSVSLFVFSEANQSGENRCDGYYSIKAADEFSDSVSQWLKSPQIVSDIYKKADFQMPEISLAAYSKIIKAQKMAPQFVEVKFKAADPEKGGKLAAAAAEVLQEKARLAGEFSGDAIFTISGGQPVVVKNGADYLRNGLLALVGGILLSIFLILFKEDEDRN
jgi:capsular polysaccharide biosynthesis protein